MEIEFQGQYDRDTIFKAVKLANKPSRRNALIRVGLAVLVAIILIAYFISVAGKGTLTTSEIFRSGRHLITILFLAYFLLQPTISAHRTAAALWKDPAMQKPQYGIISGLGIAYISASGVRSEIDWGRFAKKQVTENLIVLLTADGILSFFPRRFFKTDSDWRLVVQWVNSKVVEAT
jgi:hypothetical protein